MLTPPDEMSASHSCAPRRNTIADLVLVVTSEPEIDRDAVRLLDEREQHLAVRLADLTGRKRAAALDELVAGRDHADPRPAGTPARGRTRATRAPRDAPDGSRVCGGKTRSPAWTSLPARRTASPGLHRRTDQHRPVVCASRSSSTITTASAPGAIAAPVMMRTARPARPRGSAERRPRACRRPRGAPASPKTRRRCPRPRTAKPSTAVLSNGGTSSGASSGTDVAQPST